MAGGSSARLRRHPQPHRTSSRSSSRKRGKEMRRRSFVALLAALVMLAVPAVANAGQSYLFMQPGFTQSIFGVTPGTTILGGGAFAPDDDPWAADCNFDNSPLHRFDGASTVVVNSTT